MTIPEASPMIIPVNIVFIFFIMPAALADTVVLKNGREIKVEKTWQEQAAEDELLGEYDPTDDGEYIGGDDEKIYVASYAKLVWWRFLKHKLAVLSAIAAFLSFIGRCL